MLHGRKCLVAPRRLVALHAAEPGYRSVSAGEYAICAQRVPALSRKHLVQLLDALKVALNCCSPSTTPGEALAQLQALTTGI